MAFIELHYADILDSNLMQVVCKTHDGSELRHPVDVEKVEVIVDAGDSPRLRLTIDAHDFELVKHDPEDLDKFIDNLVPEANSRLLCNSELLKRRDRYDKESKERIAKFIKDPT